MMKHISKQILTMLALVLPLSGPVLAQSVVTEIVTNPLTGVAIDGMDPVSYFTEPLPLRGNPIHEYHWKGVPWQFATEANMEVFRRSPEIYAPQYGGHGAMSMARGFVSDSDPDIYTVFKERLYLFYSAANREAFLLSPDAAAINGTQNWQTLSKTLASQ